MIAEARRQFELAWSLAELIDTVLWVTVEVTKNVSEIGQLRLLRAAGC